MMRLTPMVKNILLINLGIFLIQYFLKLPLGEIGGLRVVFSDEFAPYQFLTYMWLHGDFGHILSNMFAVFIFGPMLEQVWGSKRFLIFYLICGIGAGVLFGVADFVEKNPVRQDRNAFMHNPTPDAFELFIVEHKVNSRYSEMLVEFSEQYYDSADSDAYKSKAMEFVDQIYHVYVDGLMVGASGAVFGILMAFGLLFPNTQLFLLFPPIPIKAKYLVLFYGLYELYSEFSRTAGDNVAHLAHLGGMLIAYILIKLWREDRRRFY